MIQKTQTPKGLFQWVILVLYLSYILIIKEEGMSFMYGMMIRSIDLITIWCMLIQLEQSLMETKL